ncbi:MAG: hypothetical protein ABUS49_11165 [Acidobacteriota bacterium]
MSVLRSLVAVAAGFTATALFIGILTPMVTRAFGVENFQSFSMGLLLATLGYTVTAAALGGYLTGFVAGRRELPHAAALGCLLIGIGIVSMARHGEARPGWYETTIAGCGPIAALFGAGVRRLTKR